MTGGVLEIGVSMVDIIHVLTSMTQVCMYVYLTCTCLFSVQSKTQWSPMTGGVAETCVTTVDITHVVTGTTQV